MPLHGQGYDNDEMAFTLGCLNDALAGLAHQIKADAPYLKSDRISQFGDNQIRIEFELNQTAEAILTVSELEEEHGRRVVLKLHARSSVFAGASSDSDAAMHGDADATHAE